MWRVELLHPATVHFPIALLLVGTAIELVSLLLRSERRAFCRAMSLVLFVTGTVAAWLAVWSGGEAEGIVNRVICDPTVTHEHEFWSLMTSYAFLAVALLALIRRYALPGALISLAIAVVALGGSGALVWTGHLGASLVYQQGAAVYHPSPTCQEFAG